MKPRLYGFLLLFFLDCPAHYIPTTTTTTECYSTTAPLEAAAVVKYIFMGTADEGEGFWLTLWCAVVFVPARRYHSHHNKWNCTLLPAQNPEPRLLPYLAFACFSVLCDGCCGTKVDELCFIVATKQDTHTHNLSNHTMQSKLHIIFKE